MSQRNGLMLVLALVMAASSHATDAPSAEYLVLRAIEAHGGIPVMHNYKRRFTS